MFINKIGTQHLDIGKNCQDYGLEKEGLKLVCDGCSGGEHTEVGAKSYCHLAELGFSIHEIFKKLVDMYGQSSSSIKNFLCFTILSVTENNDYFRVSYCGDGYIILEDKYCNSKALKYYKYGVEISEKEYSKKEYKNVGIASDGLRFIAKSDNEDLKKEFIELLKTGKAVKIKRFINRNQKIFKDDITIVF